MRGNVGRPWTNRETERLHRCFKTMTPAELEQEFAPRTLVAIMGRARVLKLRKRDWKAIARTHKFASYFQVRRK